MKITVERTTNPEGNLVFTITVSEPHFITFEEEERNALEGIDKFTESMEIYLNPENLLYSDIKNANHRVKEKVFMRLLDNLKFSIENELQPKFKPICQEIYNWIYDNQKGYVKKWMEEFDPQRSKYYFDNDIKPFVIKSTMNCVPDDKLDEEDDE